MREEEVQTLILEIDEELVSIPCSTPEKVLCAAILVGAILDIKKKGDVRRKAKRFFLSKDEEYVFSFRSICTQLEIPPEKILSLKDIQEVFNPR